MSSNTLTWTIHFLMLHPQHYKRVVDEVQSSFDNDHLITFDEAKEKHPFMEVCVYESNSCDFVLSEDVLFAPGKLDKYRQLLVMLQKISTINEPNFPERDCQVVISKC
ncbi:hypothetical protein GQ54DRAFT_301858 [Martensiomyces pterosporus]|nr:hypothetical protein GQ54DRAFT_301858 [Martensiomyces pterosporus]